MKRTLKTAIALPTQPSNSLFTRIFGKVSLRTYVIVPFLLEIFIIVGIVGYLSFRNGQKAVNLLAYQLQNRVTAQVIEELENYLETPHLVNQINADSTKIGQLTLDNRSAIERHIWQQIRLFQSVNSIYLGTTAGEVIGIDREDRERLVLKVTEDFPQRNFYLLDPQGNRTQQIEEQTRYDARTRPWYKAAIEQNKPIWSEIYSFANMKALGLTAAQPFYNANGDLQGVFATDLSLGWIDRFLHQLQISPSGQILIMERSGLLVGTSIPQSSFTVNSKTNELQRLKVGDSPNQSIRDIAAYLTENFGNFNQIQSSKTLDTSINGERQFVRVVPYRDPRGLDWLVVAIVPEKDFVAQIQRNTYITILLCLIALAVAIGLGILISYRITEPILQLSEASRKLKTRDFDGKVAIGGIKELETLAESFNQMSEELGTYSRSLEEKVRERTSALEQSNQQLQNLATIDELTQVGNRRHFNQYLYLEWRRMAREKQPLSLILFDVDNFKRYNDRYGHPAGDTCLQQIAQTTMDLVRRSVDLVARYGGEEFAVILPNTPASGAIHIAERITHAVKGLQIPHASSDVSSYVTVSLGVATLMPDPESSPDLIVTRADRALYQAKQQGRDRIVTYP